MLLALGAASSVLDALQSLTSQKSPSASQPPANPFDVSGSASASAGATSSQAASGFSPISPQTMSALIAAQGDATNTAPTNPSAALQDLFSQIDANGDGSITKTEFENALGAGGTNTAAADKVFGELDTNGDGSVSLDEMKSALQGAGGHHGHGHHMHAHGAGGSGGSDGSSDSSSDPLLQALSGASSTSVTNSDGSTTTSITYADGSKVSLTTPAASTTPSGSSSATSTYNLVEQLIQREAQALSASVASSLSVSV
jgi:hypothetical protein